MGWASHTLSNGITLEAQQNVEVRSLIDVQYEWRKGSFIKIRKGDRCLVRMNPVGARMVEPGRSYLHLGKATGAWNFRDMKSGVVEGIDFEVVDGAVPYPPLKTESGGVKPVDILDLF
jgi:hypothetical protein